MLDLLLSYLIYEITLWDKYNLVPILYKKKNKEQRVYEFT